MKGLVAYQMHAKGPKGLEKPQLSTKFNVTVNTLYCLQRGVKHSQSAKAKPWKC